MPARRNHSEFRQILIIAILFSSVTVIYLNYVLFSARGFTYEQTIENKHPPPPGKFLWTYSVNNQSYCNFNYGLPGKLDYTEKNIQFPPQEGFNSSFRVLYNVVRANYEENVPNITYVTHVTAEFVLFIPEIIRKWDGPMSLAAFVPAEDAQVFFQKLFQICFCLPQMSRVSIHLVFPATHEPYVEEQNASIRFQDCVIKNEFPQKFNRFEHGLYYPINVGRNVAREGASTYFVMVTDIELVPSKQLARNFMKMRLLKPIAPPMVFVVPIFEIESGYEMPLDKKTLLKLKQMGVAVYFHKFVCTHCQKFPGIDVWLRKSNGNKIRPFLTVKREYPFHRWEPVFIGTKQEPLYDEALSWEGLQDKMTQMFHMCLLNYKFVILDGAFLVHWPGIKKNDHGSWREPYVEKNSEKYSRIIDNLSTVIEHTKNRKCKVNN